MGKSDFKLNRFKLIRVTTISMSLDLLLQNQLKMLNHYFDVIALSSPGNHLSIVQSREGVRTLSVNMRRSISLFSDLNAVARLIYIFWREKPTIVHTNTPKASLLSMIASYFAFVPIRIYTITGLRYETEKGIKRFILINFERLTCFFSNIIVAESDGVKNMIIRDQLTRKKIFKIGNGNINGIDTNFWNPLKVSPLAISQLRLKLGINQRDFVFIFVGRLVGDKGVNELIEAFCSASLQDCKLLLVGPYESELDPLKKETIEKINNEKNIITVGYQTDVRSHIALSNVLVLPSYREGFSNVLLQAGAMGKPVISTRVNGTDELVVEYQNGIFVEKRNSDSLRFALLYVKTNYEKFSSDFCKNRVVNLFSQDVYYPQLLEFYKNIIKKFNF